MTLRTCVVGKANVLRQKCASVMKNFMATIAPYPSALVFCPTRAQFARIMVHA